MVANKRWILRDGPINEAETERRKRETGIPEAMAIAMMTMTTTATTWVVWFDGMIAGFRFVGLMGWIVECDMT